MIGRLYADYIDRLAAERGALAFVKWFVFGAVLQLACMIPALPLLALSVLSEAQAGRVVAVAGFAVAFLASRTFLFVLPCAAVADRKGLGWRATWGVGGFVFGPIVLALAAALPPRAPAAAA